MTGNPGMCPVPEPELHQLLAVRDVAMRLGLHEKTVYAWVNRTGNPLPCIRLGGRIRFDPSDILRWVSARKEG